MIDASHDGPLVARSNDDLCGTGGGGAMGVLAGLVDVEATVRMLDDGNTKPGAGEVRQQGFDERGLAASAGADEGQKWPSTSDGWAGASEWGYVRTRQRVRGIVHG